MLPIFPIFKTLEIGDRTIIDTFTRQFPPYNDFEFMSLWTYNQDGKNSFSILNGNLVIKIHDFITGIYFYSLLGIKNIPDSIKMLLQKSKEDNIMPKLYLVPEIVINELTGFEEQFHIQEDPDSFDYIISVSELANLEGSKHANRRNHISKFKRIYHTHTVQTIDIHQEKTKEEILNLFLLWEQQKGKEKHETIIELTAIKRLFDLADEMPIHCLGIYMQNTLIGFSTFHIVQDNYALLSFIKSDTSYRWIYEYLNHEIAKYLKTRNCIYLNYEQDLGIPSLREAKKRYNPIFYLKKYTIEERLDTDKVES